MTAPSTDTSGRPRPSRRLLPYGDRAVLLECADLDDAQAMHRWLLSDAPVAAPVAEIVPGARTLLLRLTAPLPPGTADALLTARPRREQPAGTAETLSVPVRYDGDDLDETAALVGMDAEELIAWHTGQDWSVAFCGFLPGFGYLAATARPLQVPRRPSPRARVPSGSVALADTWSAIYPGASPGGWRLIGRTDLSLFDVTADPPARLHPGMRVRFRPEDRRERS